MKKMMLAVVLAAAPFAGIADNKLVHKEKVAAPDKGAVKSEWKASRAGRLSDAELDSVTAGTTVRIIDNGLTIVLNPGNAQVGPKFNHNRIVCINCF